MFDSVVDLRGEKKKRFLCTEKSFKNVLLVHRSVCFLSEERENESTKGLID